MSVRTSIWLFGKPEWELDTESNEVLDGSTFAALGEDLEIRLEAVADTVDKLIADNWSIEVGLYDLWCFTEKYNGIEEATSALIDANVNLDMLSELEVDEEEFEDEKFDTEA